MHYWNRDNFEGLNQLARVLEVDSSLPLLREYCLHREAGRRVEALAAVDALISEFETWPVDKQRGVADKICDLQLSHSAAHQFIPHPLKQILVDILRRWAADESSTGLPHRWLGMLTNRASEFESALQLDPGDEYSRHRLIAFELSNIEYATHHLPYGFIGHPAEVLESARRAYSLIRWRRESRTSQGIGCRGGRAGTGRARLG